MVVLLSCSCRDVEMGWSQGCILIHPVLGKTDYQDREQGPLIYPLPLHHIFMVVYVYELTVPFVQWNFLLILNDEDIGK